MNLDELEARVFARAGNVGLGVLWQMLRQVHAGHAVITIRRGANMEKQKTITSATQAILSITQENWELISANTWRTQENTMLTGMLNPLIFRETVSKSPSSVEGITSVVKPPSTDVPSAEALPATAEAGNSSKVASAAGTSMDKVPQEAYRVLVSMADTWKENIQPDMTASCKNMAIKVLKGRVMSGVPVGEVELQIGVAMGFIADNPWLNSRNMANWAEKGLIGMTESQLKEHFKTRKKSALDKLGPECEVDMSQYPEKPIHRRPE